MTEVRSIKSDELPVRMRAAISLGWSLFSKKVGGKLIKINKEASMQLQFGYILQQLLPLITFHNLEKFELELETGVPVGNSRREIDALLTGTSESLTYRIAVELKCYKTFASSGGKRGATDIFMKDVYEDLAILERYVECEEHADEGIALVMTDMERLVHPRRKVAKCWDYDISDGACFGPTVLNTPIGGKNVAITLNKSYRVAWEQCGQFWFLEAQGESRAGVPSNVSADVG